MSAIDRNAIAGAWMGRISGCQLGKPVEVFSMENGPVALRDHLGAVGALPLRDYVPFTRGTTLFKGCCRGHMVRSEPDDDINYSVLALLLMERHGPDLATVDVARSWLELLPYSAVFTAEEAAYRELVDHVPTTFVYGAEPGFDLDRCADNPYNDWIGAQIRADVYGWVHPGRPAEAARLAGIDAALSHRDTGVHGAQFVAACGAAIPVADSLDEAVQRATDELPAGSPAVEAVELGRSLVGRDDALDVLAERYRDLSPVHTLNNLAVVVWSLLSNDDDFGAAIGEAVAAGWDTDCNGATVGGLWGLTGQGIPPAWTEPWYPDVALTLAGFGEVSVDELIDRTVAVAERVTASADLTSDLRRGPVDR